MTLDQFLNQEISLKKLELYTIDLPQLMTFKSAIGVRKSRRAMIVKWVDKDGDFGYGECSCRPDPFYSSEFLEGSILMVKDFLFERVKKAKTYGEFLEALKKIRGWSFTKAALEFALNDLLLKKVGYDILSTWEHKRVNKVPVGISLGLQENYKALHKKVKEAIALGYSRLKFKINPDTNPEDFKKIQEKYPDVYLSFDANGSFYEKDFPKMKEFAKLNVMIEQPFPPNRMDIAQKARKKLPEMFICLDESIKSLGDLKLAHQLNLMDELNLKPGRVGGIYNSLLILEYCKKKDIPCWVGGMFETGVGRTANLRIAQCLPQADANDLSPSHRYFEEDIIEEPIQMTKKGKVNAKGLNYAHVDDEVIEKYTVSKIVLK